MSKRKKAGRGSQAPPVSKKKAPPVRTGKKWLLLLLGLAGAGIVALVVFNRFWRPDRPAPDREERKPVDPPGPPTVEGVKPAVEGVKPTVEGLKKESFDVVHRLTEEFPGQHIPLGLMGMLQYQFNDPDGAIKWWQRSLDSNPRFAEAYFRMAEIFLDAGDFEKTVELCRKSLQIDQRQPHVNGRLGKALMELGRPEEAIVALKAELRNNPRSFKADNMLGQAYLALNQYEEAIRHYEKAFKKMPKAPGPCYGLAKAYTKLGRRDEADEFHEKFRQRSAAEYKSGVEKRKKHSDLLYLAEIAAKIHTTAGQVYLGDGQEQVAEEHWRRAALLDQENRLCRKLLCDLHVGRRQWAEALSLCNQLLRIDPKSPVYHLNKGVVLGYLMKLDESEKALRHGLRLAPGIVKGYHSLLQVLTYENRKLPEARAVAEKLVTLQPTVRNYVMLSTLCQQTGDLAGARGALERAALLAPGNPEIEQRIKALKERR